MADGNEEFQVDSQIINSKEFFSLMKSETRKKITLDEWSQIVDIDNKRRKNRLVLRLFHMHHKTERKLKVYFSIFILSALFIEVATGNVVMFLIGAKVLNVAQWVADTFYVGMYGQIITIAMTVVRHLFPKPKQDLISQLNEMVDKM